MRDFVGVFGGFFGFFLVVLEVCDCDTGDVKAPGGEGGLGEVEELEDGHFCIFRTKWWWYCWCRVLGFGLVTGLVALFSFELLDTCPCTAGSCCFQRKFKGICGCCRLRVWNG